MEGREREILLSGEPTTPTGKDETNGKAQEVLVQMHWSVGYVRHGVGSTARGLSYSMVLDQVHLMFKALLPWLQKQQTHKRVSTRSKEIILSPKK